MARITETIGFSVPPAIARQVERIAKAERRTKSELFKSYRGIPIVRPIDFLRTLGVV